VNAPGYLPAPQDWPDGPVREYGARNQSSGWSESATIIVACLLGVLAAALAVLVLTDAPAPNPSQSVDGPNGVGARVQSFDWAEVTRVLNSDSVNV